MFIFKVNMFKYVQSDGHTMDPETVEDQILTEQLFMESYL